jgi:hypothetical protein
LSDVSLHARLQDLCDERRRPGQGTISVADEGIRITIL